MDSKLKPHLLKLMKGYVSFGDEILRQGAENYAHWQASHILRNGHGIAKRVQSVLLLCLYVDWKVYSSWGERMLFPNLVCALDWQSVDFEAKTVQGKPVSKFTVALLRKWLKSTRTMESSNGLLQTDAIFLEFASDTSAQLETGTVNRITVTLSGILLPETVTVQRFRRMTPYTVLGQIQSLEREWERLVQAKYEDCQRKWKEANKREQEQAKKPKRENRREVVAKAEPVLAPKIAPKPPVRQDSAKRPLPTSEFALREIKKALELKPQVVPRSEAKSPSHFFCSGCGQTKRIEQLAWISPKEREYCFECSKFRECYQRAEQRVTTYLNRGVVGLAEL